MNGMKKMKRLAVAVPLWLSLWLVLAGADRGCYITEPDCGSLNEQACTANESCQAVYGYDDSIYMDGKDSAPLCGESTGTRCMEPNLVFLQCMDADDDPCEGLEEQECWRRPACEAEYIQNRDDCPMQTRCFGQDYVGCHVRTDECQSADDCYAYDYAAPGCEGFYFTCDAGQCIGHCTENGCRSDEDCAEGEHCAFDEWCGDGERCGVGHCEPGNTGCQSDDDCALGERCEIRCGNGWCDGQCVEDERECSSNEDCDEGEVCIFDEYCGGDEYCGVGHCGPANTGCQSDDQCGFGERCEIYCGNGWCHGDCVADEQYCDSDEDCPDGFYCELLDGCAPGSEDCYPYGVCVPQGCQADSDCAEGEICVFDTNCGPDENCGMGRCEPVQSGCESNADCAEGEICVFDDWCEPDEYCGVGHCEPAQVGCQSDDDCQEGSYCDPVPCEMPGDCPPAVCQPGVWTFIEPVQCGGNAWEIDAANNPERYMECYIDCEDGMDCGSSAWEELCRVRIYFLYNGIALHDLRDVWQGGDSCAACDCPRGDVIYALVSTYQLDALLSYGFQEYLQN